VSQYKESAEDPFCCVNKHRKTEQVIIQVGAIPSRHFLLRWPFLSGWLPFAKSGTTHPTVPHRTPRDWTVRKYASLS